MEVAPSAEVISASDKVVVMIETRMSDKIGFVIKNALTNLPDEWNAQIFHRYPNLR